MDCPHSFLSKEQDGLPGFYLFNLFIYACLRKSYIVFYDPYTILSMLQILNLLQTNLQVQSFGYV
jgi:hypothetical protein